MSSDDLLRDFETYLRGEKLVSEATIEAYLREVRHFAKWKHSNIVKTGPRHISKYLGILLREGMAARTAQRRHSSLRQFFVWLRREGMIVADPTEAVIPPKAKRRLVRAITEAEFEKLLNAVEPDNLRDRCILLLLFGSGLRASELVNLKRSDLNLEARIVKVRLGKGGKDRFAPLSDRSIEALKTYLAIESDSPWLFPGYEDKPITRVWVYEVVRRLGKKVLKKQIHPHQFRHGTATTLLHNGADIAVVQAVLGHSDAQTTMIYFDSDIRHLREVYERTHPRCQK